MKVAVSDGVNPCIAREREISPSRSRVAFHSSALMSSSFADFSARKNSRRNWRDCCLSSSSLSWPERSDPASSWLRNQEERSSASFSLIKPLMSATSASSILDPWRRVGLPWVRSKGRCGNRGHYLQETRAGALQQRLLLSRLCTRRPFVSPSSAKACPSMLGQLRPAPDRRQPRKAPQTVPRRRRNILMGRLFRPVRFEPPACRGPCDRLPGQT